MNGTPATDQKTPLLTSAILKTAMRLIVPLTLLFAAYVTLKGHNEPGGGFIGGLIFAIGFVMFRLAFGADDYRRLVPLHPRVLVSIGLAIAAVTTVLPLFFGQGLLTSYVTYIGLPLGETMHFASAVFFDLGVLLVVIGVSTGMIARLAEEVDE